MISDKDIILRLCISALLGCLIGLERERLNWAAGLRTHMLVSVGATLVMLVSAFGFKDILSTPQVGLDPSRVAAQVVSGIGFLGAGTIVFRREVIRGLTTAASLWTVATVGLAVGGGMYVAAGAATVIILLILAGLKPLEGRLFKEKPHATTVSLLVSEKRPSDILPAIEQLAADKQMNLLQIVLRGKGQGRQEMLLSVASASAETLPGFLQESRALPGIVKVRVKQRPSRAAAPVAKK